MRARAPGKIVFSGAYCVLHGAPALVTAVDRFAIADTSRPPEWIATEVREALGDGPLPHVDASQLRRGERKLGLGSSAAVLVASLTAILPPSAVRCAGWRAQLQERAVAAHRRAQGGGSGIDVACSVWGGSAIAALDGERVRREPIDLPADLSFEVWTSDRSASTAEMLREVRRFARRDGEGHHALMQALSQGAQRAAQAGRRGDGAELLAGMGTQLEGLLELGRRAHVPIVTPENVALAEHAAREGAVFMPAGAGGGDVLLWAGPAPSSAGFSAAARQLAHEPLSLGLGAAGAHQFL